MIQVIKMGSIIKQYTSIKDKPMLMLVIDSTIYNKHIKNLDYYSNTILNNIDIIDRFSILKTTTIHPYAYGIHNLEIGTIINKFSSFEQITHTIREVIDDVIIITDKSIFIIDDKRIIREQKLKKIGI
jgi:hypothetical protein